jgi:hypothetical protein
MSLLLRWQPSMLVSFGRCLRAARSIARQHKRTETIRNGGFPPKIASEDEVMGRTGQTDVGKA